MTQKARRILCALLTVFMLIPLCSAFAVTVGAATAPVYADAKYGELLFTADFNATTGDWTPSQANAKSWDSMTIVPSVDGSSATLTPTKDHGKNRAAIGGQLSNYSAIGNSYTVTFTVSSDDPGQCVAFYADWGTGFVVFPNEKKVSVGQYGGWKKLGDYASYTAGGTGAQTYAIEFAVTNTKRGVKQDTTKDLYAVSAYNIYVKDGGTWVLVMEMDEAQRNLTEWSDTDYEMTLRFARYYNEINSVNQTSGVTVSNVNVYKGIGLASDGYLTAYEEYQDGDKIKDVNFNAKGDWAPALSEIDSYNDLTVTVPSDGKSVTFEAIASENRRGLWSDAFEPTLPLSAGVKYTFFYHLELSGDNAYFGLYPDGDQGFTIKGNGQAGFFEWGSKKAGYYSWKDKTDVSGRSQDFAVELDYDAKTLELFVKNQNGLYSSVQKVNVETANKTWQSSTLQCCFYASGKYDGTGGETATVSNFSVYKGLTVDVWDKDATGMTAYSAADEGALLEEVFFHDTIHTSSSDSYNDVAATVAPGGRSVTFTVQKQGSANNKRAVLYDTLDTALPLGGGVIYTFVFDVTFSTADVNVGIYPDGNSGIVIGGNGTVNWKEWDTGKNSMGAWTAHTDVEGLSQTFAAILNYSQKRFYLYVKQACGSFEYVGTMGYSGAWGEPEASLNSSFFVKGTATEQSVTLSNLNIYKGDSYAERNEFETLTGAEVRLDTPTGIRFTGVIGKDYLNGLKTYGNENVKIGMVITPTDYLTDNSLAFTMADLDGCSAITGTKYVQIEAVRILDQGNYFQINCVLANIKEDNYTREFSAITYIEINGSTYYYSKYVEANHSRSVGYVAAAALEDVSETQVAEYQYKVEENKYSPYTEAQRTTLQGFCAGHTYSVMSYNIEQHDSTAGWEGRNPANVVATINNSSPDIVGLQEVNGEWNTYLASLSDYTRVQGDTTANAWDNLYYKTDLFNCTESGTENYKTLASTYSSVSKNNASIDANDADMTRDNSKRMFTYAFLTDKNTGKKILAISTHLHYRKDSSDTASTAANSQVRAYELRLLDAWIKDQDSSKFDTVVIVGDMNEHYKSGDGKAVINEFKSLGYESAIETAAIRNGDMNNTLAVTNRTVLSTYVFDYIFTGGNTQTVSFSVIDNKIDNGNTSYPSDHLPVLAKIYCY